LTVSTRLTSKTLHNNFWCINQTNDHVITVDYPSCWH
jgi:hypothetical protein